MSLKEQKRVQMNLNKSEPSWTSLIHINKPKGSIEPKYIQTDAIWAQNGLRWLSLKKLKKAYMSSKEP